MMGRVSARFLRHVVTHGQNEHEALERIQRDGLVTWNPTDEQTHLEHWSVGSAKQTVLFVAIFRRRMPLLNVGIQQAGNADNARCPVQSITQ
jgi:hypothetical protein